MREWRGAALGLPSATLLRAEYAIVPFGGRTRELAELAAWCGDDARPVALRVYAARGDEGRAGWRSNSRVGRARRLDALCACAIKVAIETREPFASRLAAGVERSGTPELCRELDRTMGHGSITLAPVAAAATRRRLAAIETEFVDQSPVARDAAPAAVLDRLSVHLDDQLETEQALAASSAAVAIYERLAQAEPEPFRDQLIAALSNHAVDLGNGGQREAAIAANQRVIEIRRALVDADPEDWYAQLELARALNNISVDLAEAERAAQGLEAVREALTIREGWVARHGELPGLSYDVAVSLQNVAFCLCSLDQWRDAIDPAARAVATQRRLEAEEPSLYAADLAGALGTLFDAQRGAADHVGAVETGRARIAVLRQLTVAGPSRFGDDLTIALTELCDALLAADERIAAREAAVELLARLAQPAGGDQAASDERLAAARKRYGDLLAGEPRAPGR